MVAASFCRSMPCIIASASPDPGYAVVYRTRCLEAAGVSVSVALSELATRLKDPLVSTLRLLVIKYIGRKGLRGALHAQYRSQSQQSTFSVGQSRHVC